MLLTGAVHSLFPGLHCSKVIDSWVPNIVNEDIPEKGRRGFEIIVPNRYCTVPNIRYIVLCSRILHCLTNAKAVIAENDEGYENEYEQFDQAMVAFHDEYIIAFLAYLGQKVIHRSF
jgi:hypothetical protein